MEPEVEKDRAPRRGGYKAASLVPIVVLIYVLLPAPLAMLVEKNIIPDSAIAPLEILFFPLVYAYNNVPFVAHLYDSYFDLVGLR